MSRWLRGLLGVGVTWAVGWGIAGGLLGLGLGMAFPQYFSVLSLAVSTGAVFGVFGFFGGATFASILRLTEGQRRFDELSLPRFTAWGAVGGLLLGSVVAAGNLLRAGDPFVVDVLTAGVTALLGAGCAATSLVIARRADDRDLIDKGATVESVGMADAERQNLPGPQD